MKRIDILTLFPMSFAPLYESIPARAQENRLVSLHLHQLRKWGVGKHKIVDDTPYGGGPGMVLKPEPLWEAIEEIEQEDPEPCHKIFLTPQGEPYSQALAQELSQKQRLLLICGHYEGIDQRVRDHKVDQEISLGDYVLSGGELPAMVLCDSIIRLYPGAIKEESHSQDSFSLPHLDHPHYTKPASYQGHEVPSVLREGNHQRIDEWRKEQALKLTSQRRPELLKESL